MHLKEALKKLQNFWAFQISPWNYPSWNQLKMGLKTQTSNILQNFLKTGIFNDFFDQFMIIIDFLNLSSKSQQILPDIFEKVLKASFK